MDAWSRRSRVALWWAPLGERDRETQRVPGDGQRGGGVAAWAGRGGQFQKETRGKRNIVQQGTRLA
jgi:hypothetical protein